MVNKVLLTGAFGNLGSLVLEDLRSAGYEVTAFDLPSPVNKKIAQTFSSDPMVTIKWGDIRDSELVAKLIKDKGVVIHLAAVIAPFSENNPGMAHDINVGGTANIIDAIERQDIAPLFIFSSSYSVFGNRQKDPPPRTLYDELLATDYYSKQKIECEELVKKMSSPWVILRLAGMVDSRMRHSDPEQARLAFRTAASNRIEYVHPRDASTAIINSISRPEAHNRIHLVGGGESCQVTHLELLQAMMGAMGLSISEADLGEDELYADWADTAESQRILDFQNHSFEDFRRENYEKFKYLRPFVRPLSPLLVKLIRSYLAFGEK